MEVLVKLEVYNEVKVQTKVKDEQFGILCEKREFFVKLKGLFL